MIESFIARTAFAATSQVASFGIEKVPVEVIDDLLDRIH
jgi:hypothetical protein